MKFKNAICVLSASIMLAGTMLGIGSPVNAQTNTVTYDYESTEGTKTFGTVSKLSANTTATGASGKGYQLSWGSKVSGCNLSAANPGSATGMDFSDVVGDKKYLTVEFDVYLSFSSNMNGFISLCDDSVRKTPNGDSSESTFDKKGTIFTLGAADNSSDVYVNDITNDSSAAKFGLGSYGKKWIRVSLDMDFNTKKLDYLVKYETTTVVSGSGVDFSDTAATGLSSLEFYTWKPQNGSTSVSLDNIKVTASDSKTAEADVTVNNVVDGMQGMLQSYPDSAEVGSTYNATNAQLGYKLKDGKYYLPKENAQKSWTVGDSLNIFNIEFEEADNDIILYEDFENLSSTDTWGFDGSLSIKDGSLELSRGSVGSRNKKTFDSNIKELKNLSIEFEWESGASRTPGHSNTLSIKDSSDNIIFGLFSAANKGVKYQLGLDVEEASDSEFTIISTDWNSMSGKYKFKLDIDFSENNEAYIGGSVIKPDNSIFTIPTTIINASDVSTLAAYNRYGSRSQTLYNFIIRDKHIEPKIAAVLCNEAVVSEEGLKTTISDDGTSGMVSNDTELTFVKDHYGTEGGLELKTIGDLKGKKVKTILIKISGSYTDIIKYTVKFKNGSEELIPDSVRMNPNGILIMQVVDEANVLGEPESVDIFTAASGDSSADKYSI